MLYGQLRRGNSWFILVHSNSTSVSKNSYQISGLINRVNGGSGTCNLVVLLIEDKSKGRLFSPVYDNSTTASSFGARTSHKDMYLLCTILASLVVFLFLKWMKKRSYFTEMKRLDGKTVLITGGNSGIGQETAIALARRGARVIIACRDLDKAAKAVREIKLKSHSLNVDHMELDLANLRSIREFCKRFLQTEKRLDVLINNAGMPGVLDWTDDGFSMCFGVNHLGHFLLTNLLLTRLKECAPSRVVTLTCSSYKFKKLDFQDLNYNLLPFFTYCRSKLANVYFSQELGRITEGKGVTTYTVNPGCVKSGWTYHFSFLFRILMQVVMWLFFVPCEMGAQTVIYCAVSDEAAKHSGGYFVDCRPATLRPFARDAGVAKKLWEASERLVKLA